MNIQKLDRYCVDRHKHIVVYRGKLCGLVSYEDQ